MLGNVPTHWDAPRLKRHLVMNDSGVWSEEPDDEGTIVLRSTEQTVGGEWNLDDPARLRISETRRKSATLALGDLVITKSSGSRDHIGKTTIVTTGIANLNCCFSNFMQRIRVNGHLDPNLLWRYLNNYVGREQLLAGATTTTGLANLNAKIIGNCQIPLPPRDEQAAIVRYLDHADEQIQRYIKAKERLIALLEEQRQTLVHQTVTRGLDPNVRLKPSGVEWLGEIPEHWETLRVRHFSKVGNGCTPQRDNAAYWTEGVHPWLNSSSVNQGTITKADQFVTDLALSECHLPRLRPGSVLVGITGQGKTRGMSAVLCMDATINQHMAFITLKTGRVSSHYLHMYLTAAYSELRAISNSSGSTKDALTCEDIKHFMVVLPPRDEQERLLSEVRRELASVDNAVDLARRQVDLMNEYRTRLIADVVTGQLDVRET